MTRLTRAFNQGFCINITDAVATDGHAFAFLLPFPGAQKSNEWAGRPLGAAGGTSGNTPAPPPGPCGPAFSGPSALPAQSSRLWGRRGCWGLATISHRDLLRPWRHWGEGEMPLPGWSQCSGDKWLLGPGGKAALPKGPLPPVMWAAPVSPTLSLSSSLFPKGSGRHPGAGAQLGSVTNSSGQCR